MGNGSRRQISAAQTTCWAAAILTAVLMLPPPALGCTVYGKGWGSKWDNPVWPNGATITWSYMTPGVGLGPSAPPSWSGTNSLGSGSPTDLRVKIDAVHGAGAFNAAVQRAFAGAPSVRRPAAPRKAPTEIAPRRSVDEVTALSDRLYAAICAKPGEAMVVLAPVVHGNLKGVCAGCQH